jgi:hypothetical protein
MALRESLPALATVLACELVAAVRAVRGAVGSLGDASSGPAGRLLDLCGGLPVDRVDRPLVDDVGEAVALLPALAATVPSER